MTFSLPKIIKTNLQGYEFLAGLYSSLAKEDKDVIVDFSPCLFFDGNLSAAIGAIFDKLTEEGYNVLLVSPINAGVKRTLSRNHFLKAWEIETDNKEKENFVEYCRFNKENSQEFKDYINQQLIKKQKFPHHTELVGKYIISNISEIFANATMHGNSSTVICCGEYSESDKVLHMAIVDYGSTIPGNVQRYHNLHNLYIPNDCESIIWAFVEGNTTKTNTGGLGLSELKEFISLNHGSLDVVSGKGYITINGDKVDSYELENSFPGTIVNMNFNFDDEKKYLMASEEDNLDLNDLL